MPRVIKPPTEVLVSGIEKRRYFRARSRLLAGDADVKQFVTRANNRYWPWEKLRYEPRPSDMTDEDAWRLVRSCRREMSVNLPITDSRVSGDRPFSYWLPTSAQHLLHRIDRRMGAPDRRLSDAERRAAKAMTRIEEAASSSILEGAATTVADAKAFLAQKRKPRTDAERMVANNYRAMQHVKEVAGQPLTPDLLNELHIIITEGTLKDPDQPGRFRQPGEKRVNVIDERNGDVVHVPPYAWETPQRIDAICRFANQTETENDASFIHPVVRAILLHFAVAYVHPWADGNGRTARAIFYWSMLRQGYTIVEFLPISQIIRGHPVQYSQAFQHTEADDSDATYFILYHLRVIERTLKEFDDYVDREKERVQRGMNILRSFPSLNPRQHALLRHALEHPNQRYTFRQHAAYHAVVYQTARTDLLGLVDAGLLEMWGGRPRRFVPAKDLREKLDVTD